LVRPVDLEALRSVFADPRETHIAVAKVLAFEMQPNKSVLFAKCKILTQDRDVVARVSWSACSQGGGVFMLPSVDDLVLLAFAEKDSEQCFLIQRLSSNDDKIPADAVNGHLALRAPNGKKTYLKSDTKISIGKADGDLTQPLVLGLVLKEFLGKIIDEFLNATQIGFTPFGPCFLDPTIRANLILHKDQYITQAATNIASQIAFTERGT
jgi:hypothetical protein